MQKITYENRGKYLNYLYFLNTFFPTSFTTFGAFHFFDVDLKKLRQKTL